MAAPPRRAAARPTATRMTPAEVARARRVGHRLTGVQPREPVNAVTALLAMQAQDHAGAMWSIGARVEGATLASVEEALAARQIVRTWPLRRTLHVIAAADVRWVLALTAPRAIAATAGRARQLGIGGPDVAAAERLLAAALAGGRVLTREEALAALERGGVATGGQRGVHLLVRLALEGLLCLGPRAGSQQTFVLLDDWVPPAPARDRDAALAELITRYFTGHGPATLADVVGWAGITTADARAGIAAAGAALQRIDVDGLSHWGPAGLVAPPATGAVDLLAGFDELVLGYKQRDAFLDPAHAPKVVPGGNGVFRATVAVDGRIVGLWTRTSRAKAERVTVTPFDSLPTRARPGLAAAAERLAAFLGKPVELSVE